MAGPRCTVCDHPLRSEIDLAILSRSVRDIAGRYNLGRMAIQRHKVAGHGRELTNAVAKKTGEHVEALAQFEVARRASRVEAINERWTKLRQRLLKLTDAELDAIPALKEIRHLEEHAARELGQVLEPAGAGGHGAGPSVVIFVPSIPAGQEAAPPRVIDLAPGFAVAPRELPPGGSK